MDASPSRPRRTSSQKEQRERVALVTGAGRGIGRATAEALAAEHYTVVVAELRSDLGRRAERALVNSGGEAVFLRTDVSDPASVEKTVRAVVDRFGQIDYLVNNAGVLKPEQLVKLPLRYLERMLAVNLRGPILVSRAVLPVMLRQRSGSIINVASQLGKVGIAEYATYCATKFGVVGFSQALADELAGTEIGVWAVCPGLVDTAMARQAGVTARERRGLIRPAAVTQVIVGLATGERSYYRALHEFQRWQLARQGEHVPPLAVDVTVTGEADASTESHTWHRGAKLQFTVRTFSWAWPRAR